MSVSFHKPVLVGRERERQALRALLERTSEGHGTLVLLTGEAGIGKTTLVDDLNQRAAAGSFLVLSGGCYDLTTTPPYGPWTEAIRGYRPDEGGPEIPSWFGNLDEIEKLGSQTAIFEGVRDFFAAITVEQPMVIVLEDLHWADPASVDALRYLARNLRDVPVLILATYRDDEPVSEHPFFEAIPALVRESQAERITVQRWNEADTRGLISSRYRLRPEDEERLAVHTYRLAEGSPFYTVELLHELESAATLQPKAGGWALGELTETQVPPLVRQVIEQRLKRLSAEARTLLEIAAVIGPEVSFDLWRDASEAGDDQLVRAVEEATSAQLADETSGRYGIQFRHALVRETLYEGITGIQLRQWHQRVAEMLASRPDPDPDRVANHFSDAEDDRRIEWLLRAGRRAQRSYAWRSTVERFDRVIALMRTIDPSSLDLGWLLLNTSIVIRYADTERGLAYAEEAKQIGEELGDRWLVAFSTYRAGFHRINLRLESDELSSIVDSQIEACRAIDEGTRALLSGSDDPSWRMSTDRIPRSILDTLPFLESAQVPDESPLCMQWGSTLGFCAHTGRLKQARWIGESVLPIADWALQHVKFVDTTVGYADVKHNLAIAYAFLGLAPQARDLLSAASEAHRQHGHHAMVMNDASKLLVWVEHTYFADEPDRRRVLLEQLYEYQGLAAGSLPANGWTIPGEVFCFLLEGQWALARELAAIGIEDKTLWWGFRVELLVVLIWLDYYQGRNHDAWIRIKTALGDAHAVSPGDTDIYLTLQLQECAVAISLDADNLIAAREWLEAHDRWLEWSEAVLRQAEGQLLWARYHLADGDGGQARVRAERALFCASDPRQPLALISAHRFLGELDSRERDYDAARDHLTASVALAERCEAPYEIALTQLAQAELALATRDVARATYLLDQAKETFERIGAKPALDRARQVTTRLAMEARAYPAGLTPREVEVLCLVAEGLSNREIAEQLYLSVRTVERHVTNIYGKIDVTNRVDAAAFAARHKLASPDSLSR